MLQKLRQRRHSRAAPRGRVALLCALALSCTACPAIVDLERDPEIEDEMPDVVTETEIEPNQADAATTRVNVTSPHPEAAAAPRPDAEAGMPCGKPSAPPVLHDGGRPAAADLSAGRSSAGVGTTAGIELALRAVLAAGYLLPCGAEHTHVLQVPDGYELSAYGQTGLCPPFETMFYRLFVSKSGQITALDGVTVNPAQLRCDGGVPSFSADLAEPPLA